MAQDLAALTNTWMTNPYMFEPSQLSNAFSNYNNAALPWPPTYNGAPVNAATGQPIQSFQQWQQQNPGGMSINSTPAQPQAAAPQQQLGLSFAPLVGGGPGGTPQAQQYAYNMGLGGIGPTSSYNPGSAQGQAWMRQQQAPAPQPTGFGTGMAAPGSAQDPAMQARINPGPSAYYAQGPSGFGSNQYENGRAPFVPFAQAPQAPLAAPQQPQAAPQASGPPNNWQAAINALANPGNPVTRGANVPMVTGSQPAGGVNNAFLQQAGAGQGMNQNFLSALRAIQARPQQ